MGPNVGLTFCFPIVGPIQRFDPDLSSFDVATARAHEDEHAAQCKRDGFIWNSIRRLSTRQRIQTEAEAYCAEVRAWPTTGHLPRLEYARVRDELREAPWFRRHSTAELDSALTRSCGELASLDRQRDRPPRP